MSSDSIIEIILALFCGLFAGLGIGYQGATREYRAAIDLACKDYREAGRMVEKMRNRLIAARWLGKRTALNIKRKASN